jgi:AbrB family looped-hinge helix DNA binding protein
MAEYTRKVGERGQVTIPKELRDLRGIEGGDEIRFVEVNDEIIIKPAMDEERLAEGYKRMADRSEQLAEEMEGTSAEATERLGDAPELGE